MLLLLVGVITAVTVCAAVIAVCVTFGTSQLLHGTRQHPDSKVEQQGDPHINTAKREELLKQVCHLTYTWFTGLLLQLGCDTVLLLL